MERPTFVTHHALELIADCHLQFHVTQPDEQIQAEHNKGLYEETKQESKVFCVEPLQPTTLLNIHNPTNIQVAC
jgi:hypothetical protein